MKPMNCLSIKAYELASRLEFNLALDLADRIYGLKSYPSGGAAIDLINVGHSKGSRRLIGNFFSSWKTEFSELSPQSVSTALNSAVYCEDQHRKSRIMELVWTGPDVNEMNFRRTDQATLEIINNSQKTLWIVSFAVYKIENIRNALLKAFDRGVKIKILLESAQDPEENSEYDNVKALGHELTDKLDIYYWPWNKRQPNPDGKRGKLHIKCAVADERVLFLSSANLTDYAFNYNMELGIMIKDDDLPATVHRHFEMLIGEGIVRRV